MSPGITACHSRVIRVLQNIIPISGRWNPGLGHVFFRYHFRIVKYPSIKATYGTWIPKLNQGHLECAGTHTWQGKARQGKALQGKARHSISIHHSTFSTRRSKSAHILCMHAYEITHKYIIYCIHSLIWTHEKLVSKSQQSRILEEIRGRAICLMPL